ncbi:MAG: cytochrome c oxidase assembly protein [Alphaproteobacteria bacterium]|nr:MAG: cytochrome c oxidase assembly protein [Alphaproteobacteria bacterium]
MREDGHDSRTTGQSRGARLWPVLLSLVLIGASTLLVTYSVPLYRLFCQVTGFGGTTQDGRTRSQARTVLDRKVLVRFDTSTDPNLPWRFRPLQRSQTVRIGQTGIAFFEAVNLSDRPITGRAVYNIAPFKAGLYFVKVQCFCFDEQTLAPHQRVKMPVTYYIDPEIAEDRNLDDVNEVTLSYTFFRAPDDPPAAKTSPLAQSRPRTIDNEQGSPTGNPGR